MLLLLLDIVVVLHDSRIRLIVVATCVIVGVVAMVAATTVALL